MRWRIDGQSADQETYEAFLALLKVVPSTWYCDDREDGGATGYQARHPDGRLFAVCDDSVEGYSITQVPA